MILSHSPDELGCRQVKCLIWDLDRTLWTGVLSEGDDVRLRPGVSKALRELDERGILHSVASRNDANLAMAKLAELGVAHFMLEPQISWSTKAASVRTIARHLSIGIEALAFIDDDPFEREEVAFECPQVLCLTAENIEQLLGRTEFNPPVVPDDARFRRLRYQQSAQRDRFETSFDGSSIAFLESLQLQMTVSLAEEDDLARAEELTLRTNQLNATGRTFSRSELAAFRHRDDKVLAVVSLADRFGDYGRIGLCLLDWTGGQWLSKLVLFSCRVLSRGVTSIFLSWLAMEAMRNEASLLADFRPTERNRAMLLAYRFAGFEPVQQRGTLQLLRQSPEKIVPVPAYINLEIDPGLASRLRSDWCRGC